MIYPHTARKVHEELVCVCVCVCVSHTQIQITVYSSQQEHKMAALKRRCATCTFLLVLKSQPLMKKLTQACTFSINVISVLLSEYNVLEWISGQIIC
jgi:hypothetical protein